MTKHNLSYHIALLREPLESGQLTLSTAATQVGCTPVYVGMVCRRLNITYIREKRGHTPKPRTPRAQRVYSPNKTAQAVLGYREQLEQAQITMTDAGKAIGVSCEWVRQLCVKLGIKPLMPHHCKKCGGLMPPTEKGHCDACTPKKKYLLSWCSECGKQYALTGTARAQHIQNHKTPRLRSGGFYVVKNSRCPECKEAARGYQDKITVACVGCGTEVQRIKHVYRTDRRKGRPGPYCQPCRVRKFRIGEKARIAPDFVQQAVKTRIVEGKTT